MSTTTKQAARFTLDKDAAAKWLRQAVKQYGEPDPGQDFPEIDNHWNPVEPDEETEVFQLVRRAVDQGIISKPDQDTDLDFEYVEDGDGGYYHFMVYIGYRLKLAGHSYEMRKLGERDAIGVPAALAILEEAVTEANFVLNNLDEYVTSRS